MWKPLSIISGLVLLAAGGIMYTQVRNPIRSERKQLAAAKENKDSALKNQTESKQARSKSDTDLEESKVLLAKNTREKNEAQAAKDTKVAEVTDATTKKDAAAKELAELEEKLKGLGGLERLVAELKVLQAKEAMLTEGIANTKGAIDSTVAHKAATDKVIAALKLKDLYQKTGTMVSNFRSRVSAVNPDLGFIVLAHGNSSNVTRGAKFDVIRGDKGVAKIVVTHLEQNSSIAEVIPGTVAPGESIQPGDLVVVSGSSTPRSLTAPASKDAKPAATKPAAPVDPTTAPATDTVPAPENMEKPADAPPADATPAAEKPAPDAAPPAPAPDATPPAPTPDPEKEKEMKPEKP